MCDFSAYVAFNKATNGQTDIKHEMGENKLSWMSLLKIAIEKLPPSQRSSLETIQFHSKFVLNWTPIQLKIQGNWFGKLET